MYEKFAGESDRYRFVELTDELVMPTARLLNDEWPRSLAQRSESLRSIVNKDESRLKIPVSLVLVDRHSGGDRVVGHASLVFITTMAGGEDDSTRDLIFLQSLVVNKNYRGQGLGKLVMTLTQNYLVEYRFKRLVYCDHKHRHVNKMNACFIIDGKAALLMTAIGCT